VYYSKNRQSKCVLIQNYIYTLYLTYNADLLPPVVAMQACIILGLWEHAIPTACNVESRSMLVITDEKLSFIAWIWCF
jgi:hypothetical protein